MALPPDCTGCSQCFQGVNGAGVLLIDSEHGHALLVKDHRGSFNDPGGSLQRRSGGNNNNAGHGRDGGGGGGGGGGNAAWRPFDPGCVAATASAELHEETRGVVSASPAMLARCRWVEVPHVSRTHGTHHRYRCYVLHLPFSAGLCHAFSVTDPSRMARSYQETTDMVRFPLQQFVGAPHGAPLLEQAASHGRPVGATSPVHARVALVLRRAAEQGSLWL